MYYSTKVAKKSYLYNKYILCRYYGKGGLCEIKRKCYEIFLKNIFEDKLLIIRV